MRCTGSHAALCLLLLLFACRLRKDCTQQQPRKQLNTISRCHKLIAHAVTPAAAGAAHSHLALLQDSYTVDRLSGSAITSVAVNASLTAMAASR